MGRGQSSEFHKQLHPDFVKGTMTCLRPEIIQARINTEFPLVLNLEPTNRCNLKCIFCPREKAAKGVGDMDFSLFANIVDQISGRHKLTLLHLHKDGEPLLHPRICDMIRYAKEKDVADIIRMNSNGILLSEAMCSGLVDAGLDDITISIDAAWPETFLKYKKYDQLARVEQGVIRLLEAREKRGASGPFVRVKLMEFDGIVPEEIQDFFERWENVADQVQVTGIHSWSGSVDFSVTDETTDQHYPCALMWYAMIVNWDGSTSFCSVDWNTELDLGDANVLPISEIWNGRKARMARASQLNADWGRFQICRDCIVWVSCGDLNDWLASREQFYK